MKPSNLPNAARSKKGKTSAKKSKVVGGSGTSKVSRKKLAGRVRGEAATEAPASSLVELAADAHNKRDNIDDLDLSKIRKRTIDLEDDEEEDASSEEGKRSPTINSVSYSKPKRPDGTKKDTKVKRKGDDELKNAMKSIVNARKEANEVRKMARNQDAVAKERRLAAEERRVAAEERKVALEERKVAMEERSKLLEWENNLFFLDTSLFKDAQKEYVNLAREQVLIQKEP
ncbi:hypothetical protein D1007_29091 [Hordeum vulgare]|nr:hypothetical protein D1007_29091 [Hordeum vulgare]